MTGLYTAEFLNEGVIFPFDKPYRWTSFDLVNKIRKDLCVHAGIKKLKVGHAGTLDPLATGLLILCVGKATKKISSIQEMKKEYFAEVTLGTTTPSYDLETEINQTFNIEHIDSSLIQKKLELFKGKTEQIPPVYSAKKFNGVRAYEYAREGINKKMKAVKIEIFELEIIKFNLPRLELKIICSKGTYIRALARDLGLALDSGGHLTGLRRTAIGPYKIKDSINLENFQKKLNIL